MRVKNRTAPRSCPRPWWLDDRGWPPRYVGRRTVDRLAAGGTLLLANRRQHRRLGLRAEALERHHASNHFQRIALRGNRRKPPVRIKKSELPHRTHTPNLVAITQIRTNSRRSLFFEVPTTGAATGPSRNI